MIIIFDTFGDRLVYILSKNLKFRFIGNLMLLPKVFNWREYREVLDGALLF